MNDHLSIRLLPGGFSFSWGDSPVEYVSLAGRDYPSELEDAILSRSELLRAWDLVVCEIDTSRVAPLPAALSAPDAELHYRLLLPQSAVEETLLRDAADGDEETSFWFGLPSGIYRFLQRTFQNVVYRHPLCSLHAQWRTRMDLGTNARLIADVSLTALRLLVYRQGALLLAVTHETSDLNNMTYFILHTWLQAAMSPLHDVLVLTGESTLTAKLREDPSIPPLIRGGFLTL